MTLCKVSFLVLATLTAQSAGHPEYRERIPNAYNVQGVEAIGHVPKGHGSRNAFGKDFDAAGRKWTVELCQKDSDGDGQTNGQELGDPCCEWGQTSNAKVRWTTGVSAPGDATSKSEPALWANLTCTMTASPSTAAAPQVAASGGAFLKISSLALVAAVASALAAV